MQSNIVTALIKSFFSNGSHCPFVCCEVNVYIDFKCNCSNGLDEGGTDGQKPVGPIAVLTLAFQTCETICCKGCRARGLLLFAPSGPRSGRNDPSMVTIAIETTAIETNPGFSFSKLQKILASGSRWQRFLGKSTIYSSICRLLSLGRQLMPGKCPGLAPLLALCHASDDDCRAGATRNSFAHLPQNGRFGRTSDRSEPCRTYWLSMTTLR